jgi:hypothetical protein
MSDTASGARLPSSSDEEIIYAESAAVRSQREDADRLRRIERELSLGFKLLGDIGTAVCVFGSARIQPGSPEYEMARATGRAIGEAGIAVITGGGPGAMVPPTAERRRRGRRRSASTSSSRTSRRSTPTSTSGSSSTTSSRGS